MFWHGISRQSMSALTSLSSTDVRTFLFLDVPPLILSKTLIFAYLLAKERVYDAGGASADDQTGLIVGPRSQQVVAVQNLQEDFALLTSASGGVVVS
jgi:hypothetical protein